tara:strand:- start:2253 stop:2822 length:570 start_codon:yes stop_codon:yes gene_type:complete
MAHTIVGKLNQSATQFQAGDGTGFGVRIGVQYYDRETKQKEWTNYEAVIFANQAAQIQFYHSALVEGSVVELSGESIKIKTFDGQNGQKITLELIGARLGYVHTGQTQNNQAQGGYNQQQAPQQQQQAQRQGYQQPQNAPQQQGGFAHQQNNAPQQQGGFTPKPQNAPQGGASNPMEPTIDFDDDIPFN